MSWSWLARVYEAQTTTGNSLPPAVHATPRSYTPAKMAKAASNTRKIDEMFSRASQEGRRANLDLAPGLTIIQEAGQASDPRTSN